MASRIKVFLLLSKEVSPKNETELKFESSELGNGPMNDFFSILSEFLIFQSNLPHSDIVEVYLCPGRYINPTHSQRIMETESAERLAPVKDSHREKAPKSTNMGIWVVGTSNQLFIRGS